MKILIVDDTKFDRDIIEMSVKKLGFSTAIAANGTEMLSVYKEFMPDCILLDWEMGETTGIELLRKIRLNNEHNSVKIIICTANNHPSFVGHAHTQGADGFITKPINPEKLLAKFKEIELL